MARNRYRPEEIVGLLRQAEVLYGQGTARAWRWRTRSGSRGSARSPDDRWGKENGGVSGDRLRCLNGA